MKRDEQISAATTAHRARTVDGQITTSGAWLDLDAAGRRAAFAATVTQRRVEAALHPQNLSTTALAVLQRIRATK